MGYTAIWLGVVLPTLRQSVSKSAPLLFESMTPELISPQTSTNIFELYHRSTSAGISMYCTTPTAVYIGHPSLSHDFKPYSPEFGISATYDDECLVQYRNVGRMGTGRSGTMADDMANGHRDSYQNRLEPREAACNWLQI